MDHFAPRKRKSFPIKRWAALTVIIVGVMVWYQVSRYYYALETPVAPGETQNISVVIKAGDNLKTISTMLFEKNLLSSESAFRWYNRMQGTDRKIISGRFLLNQGMTIPEIVEKITDRKKSQASLTVIEGDTISQIDKKLVGLELIQSGEFLQATKDFEDYEAYPFLDKEQHQKLDYPLEGFLFPDTYYINPGNFNSQDLIDLMLKNFRKKVWNAYTSEIKAGHGSIFEIITMASILEKEVITSDDRAKVAGILWKRLDEGWQLGADATLLYLKQNRTISAQDLQNDSPYNTRKFRGLPPGPIGNPGTKSVQAALQPEKTPYYFYLTRPGTGEVIYAKTNDEHNTNRQKYLRNE